MQTITPNLVNDATLLSTNVDENDYPQWDIATNYPLGAMLIYIAANTHWVIKSLMANNLGNVPTGLDTDTRWVKVSETNRWKMFDLKHTSQTVNLNSITVALANVNMVDGIYFGNLSGTSITINGVDQFDASIYSQTVSLVDNSNVYDPWTYFFAPILYKTDYVVTDLPPYALTKYTITITNPTGDAKCGTLLMGQVTNFGDTNYGMTSGLLDYSVKRANEFGDFVLTERAYSKTLNIQVRSKKNQTDPFMAYAIRYRATPIVIVGSIDYAMSYVFGFFKDVKGVVEYQSHSLFLVEFEGLS
jgi:hypothetical protein